MSIELGILLLAVLGIAVLSIWWSFLKEPTAAAIPEHPTLEQFRAAIDQECAAIEEASDRDTKRMQLEMELDRVQTQLTLKKLEDTSRREHERVMREQAVLLTRLGTNFLHAMFDPTLPEEQRARMLHTLQALLEAGKPASSSQTDSNEEPTPDP